MTPFAPPRVTAHRRHPVRPARRRRTGYHPQPRVDTTQELDEAGIPAAGDTGEADPHTAIEDALETFDADRIVAFTREGEDQRYREDLDRDELAERYGRPVDHAVV